MKLKAKRPITHAGKSHNPGDVFEASDDHAQDLIRQGHAEPHKEEGEPEKPPSGKPPGSSGSSTPPKAG